jgi:NADH dehydrogenase FAD-containing subunit
MEGMVMAGAAHPRIVVLGGGFGGLETAFYLKMRLQDRARITLVSDQDHFLFKPNTVYIPFGLDPDRLKIPLAKPARMRDIEFVQARGLEIDTAARKVVTTGDDLPYDFLVVGMEAGLKVMSRLLAA